MKNLVIFDADSLAYLGSSTDTIQQIFDKVDNKINEVLLETKADYYVLLISKGQYFRHKLTEKESDATYKGNRTYTAQPFVKTVKEYLIAKWNAQWYPNVEADDIAAWLMNKDFNQGNFWVNKDQNINFIETDTLGLVPDSINKILVAKDTDLLYSIPGRHLNFSKKLGPDTWGMEWVETSINNAPFFIWEQMVCNDNGDNIKGLYRKGKAWCDKNFAGKSLKEVQHLVFDEYMKEHGTEKGIYEFQKNFRLLHMLTTDEDYIREIGVVPELPTFTKVDKVCENITIDF